MPVLGVNIWSPELFDSFLYILPYQGWHLEELSASISYPHAYHIKIARPLPLLW
jgi:hypothetical protein